ncbi:hypothetical protein MTR67_053713 [Solanum verrucosum]|uniref:Seed biotin-containing protein SBP65 n=1 Tax=Solanum verrucosum TaxID=315347 RepID=A0AAF0VB69_SOLVR|nr:hypothetical protein MTR67_053713 [Solanum verrucosum]
MASEKAKRENDVHPAIHIKSVATAPAEHQPAVKVGGLEFSSGMQQQQKDCDTQRDKHSSHHVDQGIRGEGLGGFKIESHRKEGEEGRVHGGIHPQEEGNKKRAERKKPALTPAAVLTENPDERAKDFGASALHNAKESASQGHGAECYNETALGAQGKDTVGHGVRSGSQYVADKAAAAKDTAIEKDLLDLVEHIDTVKWFCFAYRIGDISPSLATLSKHMSSILSSSSSSRESSPKSIVFDTKTLDSFFFAITHLGTNTGASGLNLLFKAALSIAICFPTADAIDNRDFFANKSGDKKDTISSAGAQAKDAVIHGAQIGFEYVVDKARVAKDTALEKGQQAYGATKDTLSSAGQTTMQSAQQAKDYTLQKAGESKDYASEKSKNAAGYIGQKGVEAKYTTVETRKSAVGYAGEAARTAAEKSKNAAGYVGKKGIEAKDATVETGKSTQKEQPWLQKATADVVSSAAGYAGGKAVAAKDVVAGAGKNAVEYAGDKLAAAKDYVVSAEEGAADYAGKKKAETERQLEGNSKRESGGGVFSGEKEDTEEGGESESKPVLQQQQGGGGVLQAIGETLVGIGKTTTDFVAGGNKQSQTGYQQGSEKREE